MSTDAHIEIDDHTYVIPDVQDHAAVAAQVLEAVQADGKVVTLPVRSGTVNVLVTRASRVRIFYVDTPETGPIAHQDDPYDNNEWFAPGR